MIFNKILNLQLIIYNRLLRVLNFLKILPKEKRKKIDLKIKLEKMDKYFKSLNLKHNETYSRVDPIPNENFFSEYYSSNVEEDFKLKQLPIRKRDLEHYSLTKKLFSEFEKTKINILNFGSGHAGFSILCGINNHKVTNLDYFINQDILNYENIENVTDIKMLNEKFDLIYASHSLEHVRSIKKTFEELNKISHENTKFFFEVPNCFVEKKKKIKSTHTYYFTRNFFNNLFPENKYCETWKKSKESDDENGDVIRVFGDHKLNYDFYKKID